MPYELGISLRYLWMARKRRHTAFLSGISTLGLAVGVATLIVSLALLSGLQGKIKERLIASSPQLLIEPAGGNTIGSVRAVLDLARSRRVTAEPVIAGVVWASNTTRKDGRPLRIRSFTPGRVPSADRAYGRVWKRAATAGAPSAFLRRDAAAALGLSLGDWLTVVAPRARLTPFGAVPVSSRFQVVQLLPNTNDEQSFDAYLSYADSSSLFATSGNPTSIEIFAPLDSAAALQPDFQRRFPDLLVKSWKEINRPLFLALRLEKVVMFAAISLIILVAALNLISSMSMVIVEKRSQIGVLRTLGASERSILNIFMLLGLLIGLTGTLLGNAFGLGLSWAANHFRLIPLPQDVYYVSFVPFTIELREIIVINLIALMLSILATWYPARLAARLDPIVAIRDE